MAFPYLDLQTFKRLSQVPPEIVEGVETKEPGYVDLMINKWSGYIDGRLRKRYGKSLPLGQKPPALLSTGANPPSVTLVGRPTLGSMRMVVQITSAGPLGSAVFKWSFDGGINFTTGVTTGPSVVLNSTMFVTGMSAQFAVGNYDTSNVYRADSPVPGEVLSWLTILVTPDVLVRHGYSYTDPSMVNFMADRKQAMDELKEAADSNTGLWDLPIVNEDSGSGISTGGPFWYTEASPYVASDELGRQGRADDARGFGRSNR
jgi:hypothetical protein